MYRTIIVFLLLVVFTTSVQSLPEEVLVQEDQLRELETSIGETLQALSESRVTLEQLAATLDRGREELAILSDTESDAVSQHRLKLLSILIERQERKLQRLEGVEREVSNSMASLREQTVELEKQYNGIQAYADQLAKQARLSRAKIRAPSQSAGRVAPSAPAGDRPDHNGTWPYLSSGDKQAIAYARARLHELARRRKRGESTISLLEKVDLLSRKYFGSIRMEYLGDDLFSATALVRAGRQSFTLFGVDYWHTIPSRDNNALYRFIYDISSVSDPRLYLFREALIQ